MKSLSLMIGALIVILMLGATLGAINDFRSADIPTPEPYNITTGSNVTSVSIILSQKLFGGNPISAVVTSNLTEDAPIPFSYVSATRALTVKGLKESSSRRLTIDYKTDALWDYPGAGIATRMWPLFLVLGVIGLIVGAVIAATRHGGE